MEYHQSHKTIMDLNNVIPLDVFFIVLKSQATKTNKSTRTCCQHWQTIFCFAGTASTWNCALRKSLSHVHHHSHNSCWSIYALAWGGV